MRTPSEYLAAAVRRVQSQLMPDCALTLTHGDASATVTRAASSTRGEPDLSGDSPAEQVRVLALASDFPRITKGDLVSLSTSTSTSTSTSDFDSSRIVTSVRTDAALASMYVGLSQALERCAANVSGVRGNRTIRFPVGLLAVNNGLATDLTDGFAPTTVHSWSLVVAVDDWHETGEPNIGDTFSFDRYGESVTVKVTRCDRRDRHFILTARSR